MNQYAILHKPMSNYAFADKEGTFTIRLRAQKGDLDYCELYYGDRACVQSPVIFEKIRMERKWQDNRFDYFEKTLQDVPVRLCYYFKLGKDKEWIYYYGDDFHTKLPDMVMEDGFVIEGRSEYYQYPYALRDEILKEPEWFLNAVVYNIFPDSFATDIHRISGKSSVKMMENGQYSKTKQGGTIEGIRKNLDYIQELGFNCIYLNPIFLAGEYHKYDIMDYYEIDPGMGNKDDFRELVDEIHRRNMHIIIDGVFNHCSWYFPYFDDVVKKGMDSEYTDWFYDLCFPVNRPQNGELPKYACFAYEPKMPKLNTSNPKVQEYFAKVGKYWIEKFHVDGWRLDVANEIDRNFWKKFRSAVKNADPDAVLIGEVWENAENWLKGDAFDSTMNYDFRKHCREYFAMSQSSASEFAGSMTDMFLRYPAVISRGQLNLLDSHDVPRFLSLCGGNRDRWMAAFAYLCFAPGVPSVFYGDEKGIEGIREEEYRAPMPWERKEDDLEDFVKKCIQIRKEWIAPCDDWNVVLSDDQENLLIFERKGAHTLRLLLYMGEGFINVDDYCADGRILLAVHKKDSRLGRCGILVWAEL